LPRRRFRSAQRTICPRFADKSHERFAQGVFPAYTPPEKRSGSFRACGRETLRGFRSSEKAKPLPMNKNILQKILAIHI